MSHQPQEGSNRSLAHCTLLDVLWQMCHAWITYGMLRRTIVLISKSYEANDGPQGTPHSCSRDGGGGQMPHSSTSNLKRTQLSI